MRKLYLYKPGFLEDSIIYELVPKEVARLKQATIEQVGDRMDELGIHQVVVDVAFPTVIDRIKLRRHVKKLLRLRPIPDQVTAILEKKKL